MGVRIIKPDGFEAAIKGELQERVVVEDNTGFAVIGILVGEFML